MYLCRMENEGRESYEILLAVCKADHLQLTVGYKQMRDLLERLCRLHMHNGSLQMTDLSARISFVAAKVGLSAAEQNRLHTFRLTSNAILNRQQEPTREHLLRDAKTLAFFIRKLFEEDIPQELYQLLPRTDATYIVAPPAHKRVQRMRVCFQYSDEQYLYVTPLDEIADEPLRVRYNIPQINEEFAETCRLLWRHAQLNLLDVSVDEAGFLTPSFIVLEPDYLIDISSLAECYRDYGHHPANYFLSRLQPIENARPLLLGNIANLFLDEWIHAEGEVDYLKCMRKAFRRYPIELAACADLRDREKERQFFDDCKLHFDHIRETVNDTFHAAGYELDKTDAVLEPSYICEALGLQGRLDYMQRDMSSFIEMKSGKADEYAIRGKVEPKENNKVQMLLYQAVLQYSMGMDHRKVKAYLLYTRYPLLYPSRPSWAMVRRVIDLRNRIVADEYGVQLRNSLEYTAQKLEEIKASVLNERGLSGRFWETYLRPSIDNFQEKLSSLSSLEKSYFYALYNFITKELYTSKSGDVDYEGCTGAASLWLSTLAEKCESGEIIYDLRIKENHAADEHKAHLLLVPSAPPGMPAEDASDVLPNFRQGDAIVLYERNSDADNVTNKMVFKGNIDFLNENEICIRLRATQQNSSVLPSDSLYAIEHDAMDTTFRSMYQGLYAFMSATKERRDLLLSQREPQFDETLNAQIAEAAAQMLKQRLCKAVVVVKVHRFVQNRVVARLAQIGVHGSNQPQRVIVEAGADVHVTLFRQRLVLVVGAAVGELGGGNVQNALPRAGGDQMHKAEQILTGIAEAHAAAGAALIIAGRAAHVEGDHALVLVPGVDHAVELFIAALDRVGGQQAVPVVVQPGKCRIDLRIRGIAGSHRLGAGLIDDAGRGPLLVLRVFYIAQNKNQAAAFAGLQGDIDLMHANGCPAVGNRVGAAAVFHDFGIRIAAPCA